MQLLPASGDPTAVRMGRGALGPVLLRSRRKLRRYSKVRRPVAATLPALNKFAPPLRTGMEMQAIPCRPVHTRPAFPTGHRPTPKTQELTMSKQTPKPLALVVGAALVGGLAFSSSAFALNDLAGGYMLGATAGGDHKAGEGKCGMDKMDTDKDGRISSAEFGAAHGGDTSKFAKHDTDKDGFISAAEMKAHHEGKCGEGKCGEGKCGADKTKADKADKKADMEGKCGEGKCGGMA